MNRNRSIGRSLSSSETIRRDKPEFVLQMSSNSGSKYRAPAFPTPLLPNLQGGGGMIPAAAPQGVFPFVAPNMMGAVPMGAVPMPMPNMFPGAAVSLQQQQQAMWQQQMQFMQFQMLQMQQQQQAMQAAMMQQQQQQPHSQAQQQPQSPPYGMAHPAGPTGPVMSATTAGAAALDANANQPEQQSYQESLQPHVAPLGDDGASASDVANVNAV